MIFRRNHIKDGVEYSKPNSYSYILNGKERCEKLMPEDKSRKSKLVRKSFPFVCQNLCVWLVFNVSYQILLCQWFRNKAEFLSAVVLKLLKISIHQQ